MSETQTDSTYQLECPYPGDPYVTPECDTPQAASSYLIDHCLDKHPGGLHPTVVEAVKRVTSKFRQPL